MRKIILDTNFLLAPVQFKADVYLLEGELFTLESCIGELEKMSKERTKRGSQARVALDMAERNGVAVIEARTNADKTLIEYANKGYIIATNDKNLIERLKNLGHNVIRLKQKKILAEE
ncbi:MAG: hypothetical protein HYT73_02195 [Candidatus Aenigmarchaeota archaeon]|nr:hypothetical protein [Candidatus Aenigmarchaeota archaeon]